MSKAIYLDHAAATPVDPQVLAAMQPYFSEEFYNPAALYGRAQAVRQKLEAARAVVAGCLGARPAEIIFTAGGSEANNLAIRGVMRSYHNARMLVGAIEHRSVLHTAVQYNHGLIPVTDQGIVDVVALKALIDDNTVLISVMYANNELGTIQPIREIVAIVEAVRADRRSRSVARPLYVHTDAAQAANYLDLQVARLGVDFLSLNGSKIYGPKQSGALFVKAGVVIEPLVYGGGQESGLRSGTENIPGVVGFSEALRAAQAMRHDESHRLRELQKHFIDDLRSRIPSVIVNGSLKHRLPNNVHITLPGSDNERLIFALDEVGIMVAAGSACSASSDVPSHVLHACGLDDEMARASLRLTMGRSTTAADLDRVVDALASLL